MIDILAKNLSQLHHNHLRALVHHQRIRDKRFIRRKRGPQVKQKQIRIGFFTKPPPRPNAADDHPRFFPFGAHNAT